MSDRLKNLVFTQVSADVFSIEADGQEVFRGADPRGVVRRRWFSYFEGRRTWYEIATAEADARRAAPATSPGFGGGGRG